jgi:hypothetical protein
VNCETAKNQARLLANLRKQADKDAKNEAKQIGLWKRDCGIRVAQPKGISGAELIAAGFSYMSRSCEQKEA